MHSVLSFVRRQFSVIVFATLLALVLGAIYVATARPSYIAQAQLLIDARKLQLFQQQSILGDIPIDTAQVDSQVEILKSENIATAVIKKLHLNEDPEFVGRRGGLLGALIGGAFSLFESADDQQAPSPSEYQLFRHVIAAFESRLKVKRIGLTYVIGINFRAYNPERAAEIANAIADAYIEDQLEAKYRATRRATAWLQDRIKELRDQVGTAERAVVDFKTKNNIVNTGGSNDKRLLGEQQVAELTSQLVIARANTASARARLDRINSVLKTDSPKTDTFGATVTDTLKNEVVSKLRAQYLDLAARESDWSQKYGHDHLAVVNLRNQMREIRNSIFEELKRLGETYKSDYEIAQRRQLGIETDLARAISQSQKIDAKSVTMRELQSTAQTYKTIYENFLQRYMEAVQQQSFPISEARLISRASRPLGKSSPKTLLDLALACIGGIALGFGVGVLRDLSDRVFRTSEQVESMLQTECIALLPLLTTNAASAPLDQTPILDPTDLKTAARNQNRTGTTESSIVARSLELVRSFAAVSDRHGANKSTKKGKISTLSSVSDQGTNLAAASPSSENTQKSRSPRTIVRAADARWEILDAPLSRYSEEIRSIKLACDLNARRKTNRVVGLTSSLPNEGKSTVSFSLAQLMSQVGARTILVDCDLRNPSLSRELAPRAKAGLLDIVSEKVSLEETVWKEPTTNMTFLPILSKFRVANSTEILYSPAITKLFEQLRESYDYVVVDLPPLAPIVDVRATAHLIDSFVFIVEWGRTKTDVVEHALGHAQAVYENLLGVVLNKVDMNIFGRFTSHRRDLYYNKHYERYGYTE